MAVGMESGWYKYRMNYRLTEVVIRLHIIHVEEIVNDGLHPMEHTHVANNTAVSIRPRECTLANSQTFEAETLLISGEVRELA